MRKFNTEGPVVAEDHYCVPPLERVDRDELLGLIRDKRYFVLHAPRQTGKTSTLPALRDLLNSGVEGGFRCVYANVEVAQTAREDVREAMQAVLGELSNRALEVGDGFLDECWSGLLESFGPHNALTTALSRWSASASRPLVLLLDEVDSLVGDSLISVLRQLRAGYDRRPRSFPQSVALCGVRDVRDYRIHSSADNAIITGGRAFNVRAASLRLGDFDEVEVRALLAQHTADTGQAFTAKAIDAVWTAARGQPWLVNALCRWACFDNRAARDRSCSIGSGDILDAREHLIASRHVHVDQLADKLREERVRRVVEPLLSGAEERTYSGRDLEYVRDLGLLAPNGPPRIANPIYGEVIPRELSWVVQDEIVQEAAWYVNAAGGLDMDRLLAAFQAFFREHSEHWVERFEYREAGPQLLLQAFLQRIVNGGGRIEREYGLGRGRTDLLVAWPRAGAPGPDAAADRIVIECKVLRGGLERTIAKGLQRTAAYADRCAAPSGHLVIFDRDPRKPWEEKIFRRTESVEGRTITVWGM